MKRRLLSQLCLVLTFLVSQIGFASGHPRNGGSNMSNTANPNSCTQEDKCFVFNYKGYQISLDEKNVTLTFSIKTNCAHDLSYAAFEIPAGSGATATGSTKFKYKTEITNNPFRSIKFEGTGISGYKNGVEDVFKYVISKTDFDKLTTIRVQAKAATTVGTVTFVKNCSDAPVCLVTNTALSNILYTADGKTSSDLKDVAQPGKTIKVCFTVAKGTGFSTYSFVSYKAPAPTFNRLIADMQVVFDRQTVVVGPEGGNRCMEIKIPDCYYQVDFVKGCVIEKLGPANSTNFYTDQNRLIATTTGGSAPCAPICAVNPAAVTNIKYYLLPNATAFTPELRPSGYYRFNAIQQGNTVRVCFTVPAGATISTYSFVSYTAPLGYFDESTVNLQKVFDYKTINVAPDGGNYCMDIKVPNCYFQVDFVKGCVNPSLTPATLYAKLGRLIGFKNGGTIKCVPVEPEPPVDPETIGKEGCTPGYWKQAQHFGNWAPLIPTGENATKFFDVFTVCDQDGTDCAYQGLSPNLTLLEALTSNGGGFNALARHAAAAYLNAKNKAVKYSFTSMEIKDWVITAFKTGTAGATKDKLEAANEKGCPLGRSELTYATSVNVAEPMLSQSATALSAYPNPFNNKAVVRFALKNAEEYSVSLYNVNGKQVRVLKTGAANAGELVQLTVDASGLSEGLFLVRLITKTESQTVKLVLKK